MENKIDKFSALLELKSTNYCILILYIKVYFSMVTLSESLWKIFLALS